MSSEYDSTIVDAREPKPRLEHDEHHEGVGASEKASKLAAVITAPKKNKHADLSQEWLDNYTGERFEITEEDSDAVRRKVDRWLLPIIFSIYWTQQLDKSSLSFSSIFGLSTDANLQGQDYSWLSSIVYFAQLGFQPLSVFALVRFPVNYWICACFIGWGGSLMIMTAFTNFGGLAAFRFILGAFEASIAPSMLVTVSMWWTRREQPLRNNIWYSANGMATILGSLLSYGLGHAQTRLYPYQLIFLVCGTIAVCIAIPVFFIFPAHPTKAKFLSDREKYIAIERIRLNNTGTQSTEFKWEQVKECFLDPKSYGWVIIIFCISLVSGGIGAFGPLILEGFGLNQFQTILYNMIPGGIGIVSNILTAFIVQYTKLKSPTIIIASLFPLAAAAALYALPKDPSYKQSNLAVFFILQVFQCITALVFSWAFANTAGHTKKTTTTGMLYIGLTVGNIVGPQLYKKSESPTYHTGLTANMVVLCIMVAVMVLQTIYLSFLNSRNVKRRAAKGKTSRHVDMSLESAANWKKLRAQQAEINAQEGHKEVYNQNAFEDLTDLQNEDFVYSL